MHRGGTYKAISNIHKHKLVYHENKVYDGYRLTYLGYDFLCLKAMSMRDTVVSVGSKIGVGKESDIYACAGPEDEAYVLKLARLGRISFRNIKTKRDYLVKRKAASWLYMSRLAAYREYSYMQILREHGLPIPRPVDWSRHGVLMERVQGYNLASVNACEDAEHMYRELMAIILKFASFGLIHCDFNEFNLMVSDAAEITVIDFPQMVSIDHFNAQYYFERDVQCIVTFFAKRFGYESEYRARWQDVQPGEVRLDQLVKASGVNSHVGLPGHEEEDDVDEQEEDDIPEEEDDDDEEEEKPDNDNDNDNEEDNDEIPDIPVDDSNEESPDEPVDEEEDEEKKKPVRLKAKNRKKQEKSTEDLIRANVRKEMRKKGDRKHIKSAKRQGKRAKQRDGQRKVKEVIGGGKAGGW